MSAPAALRTRCQAGDAGGRLPSAAPSHYQDRADCQCSEASLFAPGTRPCAAPIRAGWILGRCAPRCVATAGAGRGLSDGGLRGGGGPREKKFEGTPRSVVVPPRTGPVVRARRRDCLLVDPGRPGSGGITFQFGPYPVARERRVNGGPRTSGGRAAPRRGQAGAGGKASTPASARQALGGAGGRAGDPRCSNWVDRRGRERDLLGCRFRYSMGAGCGALRAAISPSSPTPFALGTVVMHEET